MAKRIVVTGGRDYSDTGKIAAVLSAIQHKHGIAIIIQGGADGADRLCAEWGWNNGIPVGTFNADWKAHGKAAGPMRNQRMIDEGKPDAAVAFEGGRGTDDMVNRIKQAGIPLWDLR
jgi:predicted Rossmann-fold nucleotide-binding protein